MAAVELRERERKVKNWEQSERKSLTGPNGNAHAVPVEDRSLSLDAPVITGPEGKNPRPVLQDASTRLFCDWDASPRAQVEWFKDGELIDPKRFSRANISSSETQLYLYNVQPTDAGKYRCVVSNEYGQAKRQWTVQVMCKFNAPKSDQTNRLDRYTLISKVVYLGFLILLVTAPLQEKNKLGQSVPPSRCYLPEKLLPTTERSNLADCVSCLYSMIPELWLSIIPVEEGRNETPSKTVRSLQQLTWEVFYHRINNAHTII
ncbi:immunoglobulin I-set domain protein [Opisthorchis viverrini]|uniref:Immunoglobulin I-set domain protein n=1 Tax=Opisthorchis viverrini TaxID=6198 RepID=A0A1S8WXE0_OPIVI|nr:immunoglobulin I-set domain protein [Opisthorchis viverrini]